VIGTLNVVPSLGWGVVAEMDKVKAFAQIADLQRMTLVLVACLLVGIGLCAYFLGLTIVRPLRRLTLGADQVAAGDLDVDLPVNTRSEVGYLTQVFNHMVARCGAAGMNWTPSTPNCRKKTANCISCP
jgi:nitrogen fixation/metabolism regulation signal transduction histidine kinase